MTGGELTGVGTGCDAVMAELDDGSCMAFYGVDLTTAGSEEGHDSGS
jgi:hypothetical protein